MAEPKDHDEIIQIIADDDISTSEPTTQLDQFSWKVLVVDDDEIVHASTELSLKGEHFYDQQLILLHAYNEEQALDMFDREPDICVAFIDVVMKTSDAGLSLVKKLRSMGFEELRIILRTGQPGYAPETKVIRDYDINDYRTKSELTKSKLISVLMSALRAYQQIHIVNKLKAGLETIVNASTDLLKQVNVEKFAHGVLNQIIALDAMEISGVMCLSEQIGDVMDYRIISSVGKYSDLIDSYLSDTDIQTHLQAEDLLFSPSLSFGKENRSIYLPLAGIGSHRAFVYLVAPHAFTQETITLLKIFGTNIAACFRNIDLIEKLDEMAYRDLVTGIPNLNSLELAIENTSEKIRETLQIAIMHIDHIGKLSSLFPNEQLYNLFLSTYSLLKGHFPKALSIARSTWGDFMILFSSNNYSLTDFSFLNSVKVTIPGSEIPITASIAGSGYNNTNQNFSLIQRATLALALKKQLHRGKLIEYQPSDYEYITDNLRIQHYLLEYFRNGVGRFEIYLQPKIDSITGETVGAEALSRFWIEDEMVSPDLFIPLIDNLGLSMKLLANILCELSSWQKHRESAGQTVNPVSVNLSMHDVPHSDFADDLLKLLKEANLTPNMVEFEITESFIMTNATAAISQLEEIHSKGYRIAIDDFGTGYSSLSYLKQLPVDILKIDKAFMDDISSTTIRKSIVSAIAAMAETLGLDLVGEGVENKKQVQALQFIGCNICQGFLFSKPVPMSEYSKKYP